MRRQREQQESYDPFGSFSIGGNTKSSSSSGNDKKPHNSANNSNNNNNNSNSNNNVPAHVNNHASSIGSAGGISHAGDIDWSTVPKTIRINFIERANEKQSHQQQVTNVHNNFDINEQRIWRRDQKIVVQGITPEEEESSSYSSILKPIIDLKSLRRVHPQLHDGFVKLGFKAPTPIQSQAWPLLFAGKDVVGIAKTGSGKTLAFIVPAVAHALVQLQHQPLNRGDGPLVLVLAPTRELALQIDVEARKLFTAMKDTVAASGNNNNSTNHHIATLRSLCIFGGMQRGPQLASLRDSPTLVVATPGRLLDLFNTRQVGAKRCVYVVLDEADRCLDMGFAPQIRDVFSFVRPDRQTLMFSATWPKEVQQLAKEFTTQEEPVIRVHIGSTDEILHVNPDVKQHIMFLRSEADKFPQLKLLLGRAVKKRVLVFVKKRTDADDLEKKLNSNGYKAFAFHGDKEQNERMEVLSAFRKSLTGGILVATDVAARGLDIKELEVVVNYDFPMTLEDFCHRVGRTARAGATGDAYSFITKKEEQLNPWIAEDLVHLLEDANQPVPTELRNWAADTNGRPRPDPSAAFHQQRRDNSFAAQLQYKMGNKPSLNKERKGLDLGLDDDGEEQQQGLDPEMLAGIQSKMREKERKKTFGGGGFGSGTGKKKQGPSFDPFA